MRVSCSFTPESVFELVRPLAEVPEALRLRALEWRLLLAVTGRHSVAQIGAVFGVEPDLRDRTFAALLERGLLAERELSRTEFERARGAVDADEPRTLAAFLADEPSFQPLDAETTGEPMAPVLPLPRRRRLRLRALLDFLAEGAESAEDGQMNAYRLFIRLDPELLRRSGIKTLRFEDDRHIDEPELVAQIVAAVEAVFGRPCPDRVFD